MKGIIKANVYQAASQKGAILPLFVIGLAFIVGMAGLAIDSSHSFVNVTRLQNALDAAALSAGRTLNSSSGDETLSDAHGTTTFNEHLASNGGDNEMANSLNIGFEFSEKLVPFVVNTSVNPSKYVRATVTNHTIPIWFARVLPGVGTTTTIGTTAVSGPIPIGGGTGEVCDVAPMVVCGVPPVPGVDPVPNEILGLPKGELFCLKASASTGGNGGPGPPKLCTEPADKVGPGNFQLIGLPDCQNGGDCVRENMAGKYGGCLAGESSVETKPGKTVGPTTQGFNTRFGMYNGGGPDINADNYPPDQYISHPMTYDTYTTYQRTKQPTTGGTKAVADRRIMSVPIGDCSTAPNGQGTITLLGFGCFFMREPTVQNGKDNWIIGELIDQCEASGDIAYTPDVTDPSLVNYRIILYNDPDNLAS